MTGWRLRAALARRASRRRSRPPSRPPATDRPVVDDQRQVVAERSDDRSRGERRRPPGQVGRACGERAQAAGQRARHVVVGQAQAQRRPPAAQQDGQVRRLRCVQGRGSVHPARTRSARRSAMRRQRAIARACSIESMSSWIPFSFERRLASIRRSTAASVGQCRDAVDRLGRQRDDLAGAQRLDGSLERGRASRPRAGAPSPVRPRQLGHARRATQIVVNGQRPAWQGRHHRGAQRRDLVRADLQQRRPGGADRGRQLSEQPANDLQSVRAAVERECAARSALPRATRAWPPRARRADWRAAGPRRQCRARRSGRVCTNSIMSATP